jgi:hypothetical protein
MLTEELLLPATIQSSFRAGFRGVSTSPRFAVPAMTSV